MEVLSSSHFARALLPNLLDPAIRLLSKPPCRRRRAVQTLASNAHAPTAAPSPSPSLALLLATALRGGRTGGELPDLATAATGGAGIGTLLMSTTAAAVTKARESPYLLALAANPTFVSGLVAWAVAQAAKALLTSVVERRWDLRMLFSSGGMPSSHTALCTALTASVALCHGVSDALFPVCLGFSLIVMYDATGVRRHAGMQAEVNSCFTCMLSFLYLAMFWWHSATRLGNLAFVELVLQSEGDRFDVCNDVSLVLINQDVMSTVVQDVDFCVIGWAS
jgi:acid phosphatase family membrane protein YuiD